MTSRVKLLFIFLAVMAVVSVISFFDILTGVRSANIHEGITPLLPISEDADQDGLSDADESIWDTDINNPDSDGDGFLDGEEVASGKDPRIAANEDDDLGSTVFGSIYDRPIEEINVTDITNELLAGAIGDGVFNRDGDEATQDNTIDLISLSALESYHGAKAPVLPTLAVIDNSKDNKVRYLNELSKIIQNDLLNFPQKLDLAVGFDNQVPYFSAKQSQFNSSFEKAAALKVPADWADIHRSVLNAMSRLSSTYGSISAYESDMLKAVIALNEVNNLNLEAKAITKAIQAKIATDNLSSEINSDVYVILEMLLRD